MKLLTVLLTTLISYSSVAQAVSCRNAVVLANLALGDNIDENSFSVNAPEGFTMTTDDFNSLSPEAQEEIYLKYMPIETMVRNVTGKIESNIMYIKRHPFMAYYRKDHLKNLEEVLGIINTCQYR